MPDQTTTNTAAEIQIETREWVMRGEHIIDDPLEYTHDLFVRHDDLPEIIAAYLNANKIPERLAAKDTEIEFHAARPGVDYCGATHPEHGECFLDIDEEEHEHGHESETGLWPTDYQTSIDSARWRPAPSPQENSEASDGE